MNWMTFKKLLIVINASPMTAVYCKELLAKLQLSESNFNTQKVTNKTTLVLLVKFCTFYFSLLEMCSLLLICCDKGIVHVSVFLCDERFTC